MQVSTGLIPPFCVRKRCFGLSLFFFFFFLVSKSLYVEILLRDALLKEFCVRKKGGTRHTVLLTDLEWALVPRRSREERIATY